jgi:hypothetical protein
MPDLLFAKSMGGRAAQALTDRPDVTVRGITSRGVYLFAPPHTVVFLTRDPTNGPFTVNVAGFPEQFTRLENGSPVRCLADRIDLEAEGLSIATKSAEIWQPPAPPTTHLADGERRLALARLARIVVETKGWVGLAGFLPGLAGIEGLHPPEADPLGLRSALAAGRRALSAGDARAIFDSLMPAFGRGPGLTPSGDDLWVGVLLALRRGVPGRLPPGQLDWLANAAAETAYRKTTTYSANLIEAAGSGEADERLLAACDAIFAGAPDPQTAARAITHWGSTSGVDTLLGFALVATAGFSNPSLPPQETR